MQLTIELTNGTDTLTATRLDRASWQVERPGSRRVLSAAAWSLLTDELLANGWRIA